MREHTQGAQRIQAGRRKCELALVETRRRFPGQAAFDQRDAISAAVQRTSQAAADQSATEYHNVEIHFHRSLGPQADALRYPNDLAACRLWPSRPDHSPSSSHRIRHALTAPNLACLRTAPAGRNDRPGGLVATAAASA